MEVFSVNKKIVIKVGQPARAVQEGEAIGLTEEEVREAFALLCEYKCKVAAEKEGWDKPMLQNIVAWAKGEAAEATYEYIQP